MPDGSNSASASASNECLVCGSLNAKFIACASLPDPVFLLTRRLVCPHARQLSHCWQADHGLDEFAPYSRSDAGAPLSNEAVPTLAMIRSLLIMIGDDRISRRWRPILKSPSLRYPERPQACIALITVATASSEACTLSKFMPVWKSTDSSTVASVAASSKRRTAPAIAPRNARMEAPERVRRPARGGRAASTARCA